MKRSRISSGTARDRPFFSAAPAAALWVLAVASGCVRGLVLFAVWDSARCGGRERSMAFRAASLSPRGAWDFLRRLGSESTKNKLYFAFREHGRVIRTLFLLKYLNDPELRRNIHAATNKSEQFNDFAQWLMFGGDGTIAENVRHEQRKVIKYNHLVANMVILYNVQWMSRRIREL